MRICYIPSQTPYGNGEQFVLPEILEIINKGNEVLVIPIKPNKDIGKGEEPQQVSKFTIRIPLLDLSVIIRGFLGLFKYPTKCSKIIINIFKHSGSFKKIIKNLVVFPKGIVTGEIIKKSNIDHIHCHWASTPSTVGYIASIISEVPWSFTSHRWDIAENNMLAEKAKSAKFVRVIDQPGYNEMIGFIGEQNRSKCKKIHVGVKIEKIESQKVTEARDYFSIVTAANFVEKKGHKYLISAVRTLVSEGYNIKCYFYGDGVLEQEYKELVRKYNLEKNVCFMGKVAHDGLIKIFNSGDVDCVVLPSIVTNDGEKEGIPVTLMEGMAARLPVISTITGGIPELLEDKAGILVEEKESLKIKSAIEELINNKELRVELADNGYKKVYNEFYITTVVNKMLELFKN